MKHRKKKREKRVEGKTNYYVGVCPTCIKELFFKKDTSTYCPKCGKVEVELKNLVFKYDYSKKPVTITSNYV